MRDRQNGEGGFTLIELMVVVMIIAILLGIAIPAFLGAKSRAQDTAAKSNLRNALGAAQTRFSDQQVFEAVATIVTGLAADEPSLTFKNGSVLGAGNSAAAKEISVDTVASVAGGALDEIYLASYSKSGTCFFIRHLNATGGGTFIYSDKVAAVNCTAKDGEAAGIQASYTSL
jgi:type IV pilus assembly protein PilA